MPMRTFYGTPHPSKPGHLVRPIMTALFIGVAIMSGAASALAAQPPAYQHFHDQLDALTEQFKGLTDELSAAVEAVNATSQLTLQGKMAQVKDYSDRVNGFIDNLQDDAEIFRALEALLQWAKAHKSRIEKDTGARSAYRAENLERWEEIITNAVEKQAELLSLRADLAALSEQMRQERRQISEEILQNAADEALARVEALIEHVHTTANKIREIFLGGEVLPRPSS